MALHITYPQRLALELTRYQTIPAVVTRGDTGEHTGASMQGNCLAKELDLCGIYLLISESTRAYR